MVIHFRIAVLFTTLSALVVAAAGASNELIVIGFQDSQVRKMALHELDRRDIRYEHVDGNAIRFSQSVLPQISRIVKDITYEVLPPDRSANYVKELQLELMERLDAANMPYRIVEYGDLEELPDGLEEEGLTREWIVWEEQHSAEVSKIMLTFQEDVLKDDFEIE